MSFDVYITEDREAVVIKQSPDTCIALTPKDAEELVLQLRSALFIAAQKEIKLLKAQLDIAKKSFGNRRT
jgi:hypothetical protein